MVDSGDPTGEMTLAFSLAALERLADPASVFDDAATWSRFLGVVDNDNPAVEETVVEHDLRQDFEVDEDEDIWLVMERVREATATPRHVYVGANDEERRVATQLGWEFVHVSDAAEKAEWRLADERSQEGVVARLRKALADRISLFGDA